MKNYFICIIMILFASACGNVSQNICTPNYVQSGLEMKVRFVEGSDFKYSFEVCHAPIELSNARFSVYGVLNESQILNINLVSDVRLAHIEDGLRMGDVFEVDFSSADGDTWFVIFEDNGFSFDNTNEILRGNLLSVD